MKIYYTLILTLIVILSFGQANSKKDKDKSKLNKQTLFGIQISPLIPSNFIQKNDFNFENESVNYSINYQPSLSYGIEIRHFFTYRFALNTGIIYTKRQISAEYNSNYKGLSRTGVDTSFTRDLRFISFEIPIRASGYVRLSKQIYMSIAGGLNLVFYPSDIRVDNIYVQRAEHMGVNALQFFQLGYSASFGWEFRSKDSGTFYLGASYQTRLDDMAYVMFFEKATIHSPNHYKATRGNYLSIDIKYFFPINESKRR